MTVRPIPDGYHSITPYLVLKNASAALDFYGRAFGAKELFRIPAPGDKIGHAEMQIADSIVMLADEHPEGGHFGPETFGGTPVSLLLYVEDVDGVFRRALDAGATELQPVSNKFYGDRSGMLRDPFGHIWSIATHVEDVSPEEMTRRMNEMEGGDA